MPKNYPDIKRKFVKPDFYIPVERELDARFNCKVIVKNRSEELIGNASIFMQSFIKAGIHPDNKMLMGGGLYTNEEGYAIFNTTKGLYRITVSHSIYQEDVQLISIKKNEIITIKLNLMKAPVPGQNQTQSFFDYETTFGKVRIGIQALRMFFERAGKTFFMDGKLLNQTFTGTIDLGSDLTHYNPIVIASNAEVLLAANPVIGGSAEIRMIGNGVNTPLFGAFIASTGTDAYDPTLNAVNKVVFYYDGTAAFYSITNL